MNDRKVNDKLPSNGEERTAVRRDPADVKISETVVDGEVVFDDGPHYLEIGETKVRLLRPYVDEGDVFDPAGDAFLFLPVAPLKMTDETQGIIEPDQSVRRYNEWHAVIVAIGTGPYSSRTGLLKEDGTVDITECKYKVGDRVIVAGKSAPITLNRRYYWLGQGTVILGKLTTKEEVVESTWKVN